MAKKANPKLIGIFVVGAVALLVIGVVVFGGGKFFAKKERFVLYFAGSVKGLSLGAPVTLRGVEIGKVTGVKVLFNRETLSFQTPVYIEMFADKVQSVGKMIAEKAVMYDKDTADTLDLLVQLGLRAQLDLQSMLTGKLQVSFDVHPGTQVYYANIDKEVRELPTVPSNMQRLAQMLRNLDLEGMVKDVRQTLAVIKSLVSSPEVAASIVSLHKTLDDIGKLARTTNRKVGPLADSATTLIRNVDGQVDPLMANLNQTLDQARAALEQAQVTLASVGGVVAEDSMLMWELERTLKELRNMSRSINDLAEDLQRQPDSIIRGKSRLGGN
jgi:paraquat-inducible protein B